jgi:hypothetical protein
MGNTVGMNSTGGSLDPGLDEAFGGTIGNILGTLSHDSYMIAEEEEEERDDAETKENGSMKPGVKRGVSKRLNLSDSSASTAPASVPTVTVVNAPKVSSESLPPSTFDDNATTANVSLEVNSAALDFLTSDASGLSSGSSLGISLPEDEINHLLG